LTPIIATSAFPNDAVAFTHGNPKYYEVTHEHTIFYRSSLIAERGFCPTCGSGLVYRPLVQRWSDWIVIFTASLDHPEEFGPRWHLGVESQMPWLNIQDDLSRVRCKDSPGLVAAYESVGLEVT
jgi:adenylate cyclase